MTRSVKKEPLSQKQLEIIQYNIDSALYGVQAEAEEGENDDGIDNGEDTEEMETDSNPDGDKTVSTIIFYSFSRILSVHFRP